MAIATSSPSSFRIIIVDDEMDIANRLKNYLISKGFDAISFTDPLIALEHFSLLDDKYSLVMTDLRMPGMSGLDFASKIREINNAVRIFLMSAFDVSDLENNFIYKSANIERVIQKPIKFSLLKELLNNTLLNHNIQISNIQ